MPGGNTSNYGIMLEDAGDEQWAYTTNFWSTSTEMERYEILAFGYNLSGTTRWAAMDSTSTCGNIAEPTPTKSFFAQDAYRSSVLFEYDFGSGVRFNKMISTYNGSFQNEVFTYVSKTQYIIENNNETDIGIRVEYGGADGGGTYDIRYPNAAGTPTVCNNCWEVHILDMWEREPWHENYRPAAQYLDTGWIYVNDNYSKPWETHIHDFEGWSCIAEGTPQNIPDGGEDRAGRAWTGRGYPVWGRGYNLTVPAGEYRIITFWHTAGDTVVPDNDWELLSNLPNVTRLELQSVKQLESAVDLYDYSMAGYLLMKVQFNNSGVWVDEETVLDDVLDNTLRIFNSSAPTDLTAIWDAAGAFNTLTRENGIYRVYAEIRDFFENILLMDNSTGFNGTDLFEMAPSPISLDMNVIRIYDVTNTSGKDDTDFLVDSGLNTTFRLFTNRSYRAEILVDNLEESTQNWSLNTSQITHSNLNETWNVVTPDDIYYRILNTNYTSGNFSGGAIEWNTSQNGESEAPDVVSFFYIFNTTINTAGYYQVDFDITNH